MKLLFSLLFLFALTSCAAQVPEPPIVVTAHFEIMQIGEESATLFSRDAAAIYEIDAPDGLEKEWTYFFILQVAPGQTGKVKKALVKYYGISEDQAGRNNKKALELFEKVNAQQ